MKLIKENSVGTFNSNQEANTNVMAVKMKATIEPLNVEMPRYIVPR
jgi:hypothetical protein